jgi:hypothetical protein
MITDCSGEGMKAGGQLPSFPHRVPDKPRHDDPPLRQVCRRPGGDPGRRRSPDQRPSDLPIRTHRRWALVTAWRIRRLRSSALSIILKYNARMTSTRHQQ